MTETMRGLWGCCGSVVGVLWGCRVDVVMCCGSVVGCCGMLWGCCRGVVGVLWGCCGGVVRVLWGCCGGFVGVLWLNFCFFLRYCLKFTTLTQLGKRTHNIVSRVYLLEKRILQLFCYFWNRGVCHSSSCCVSHNSRNLTIRPSLNGELNFL